MSSPSRDASLPTHVSTHASILLVSFWALVLCGCFSNDTFERAPCPCEVGFVCVDQECVARDSRSLCGSHRVYVEQPGGGACYDVCYDGCRDAVGCERVDALFEICSPVELDPDPFMKDDMGEVSSDDGTSRCSSNEQVFGGRCVPCAPGTTREPGDDPTRGDTRCEVIKCLANYHVFENTCVACAPGMGRTSGDLATGVDTSCTPIICGVNEHVQANTCVSCLEGFTRVPGDDASGPDTVCAVVPCGSNEHVREGKCVRCPPGTYNTQGDDASGPDTSCTAVLCGQDERVRQNRCAPCALGERNRAGDDASGHDTTCDREFCASNEHVIDHMCVDCGPGKTNPTGDDPAGQDTECERVYCLVNQRVMSHACVSCPPGTSRVAGDDASLEDTYCAAFFCGVNERVVRHQCVSCPPGSSSEGGADASGDDTACDGILCLLDERVESNACVPCAPGELNSSGDDASGADTSCEPIVCGEDERVQAHMCASCEPGTRSPGGLFANGGDTTCEPVFCLEDEHVSNHTCISCGPTSYRPAGDDARGGDTSCLDECESAFGIPCSTFGPTFIKSSNPDAYDFFGWKVAISGDTLVVTAEGEDSGAQGVDGDQANNTADLSGAAYVYVRDQNNGTWSQQAYLKASNAEANDRFGSSVVIDGDTIAIGAIRESSSAQGVNGDQLDNSLGWSGAVYVFERSGTTWSQTAYIKASNPDPSDNFGERLSLDGDTLVVGVPQERSDAVGIDGDQFDNSEIAVGAAYVFVRSASGVWSQQAYIKASNAENGDRFGSSVSIDGDLLAVSAHAEDSNATGINGDQANNSAQSSGAVYIFRRDGLVWTQEAYLKASNAEANDIFGYSNALDGQTLVVGAMYEDGNAVGVGGNQTDNSFSTSGAAYVFVRDPNTQTWSQQAYLKASNTEGGDNFGHDVIIEDDLIAVSTREESSNGTGLRGDGANNSSNRSGAVYFFERAGGGSWQPLAYLKAPNPDAQDVFGHMMSLDNGALVISALGDDSDAIGIGGDPFNNNRIQSGAVFVYQLYP